MKTGSIPLNLNPGAPGPGPVLKSNVHIHLPPNFSAFDNIEHAVRMAAAEGISVLGASNYYFYELYTKFSDTAEANGIVPLFGIEVISTVRELAEAGIRINDPGNPGRMYICGKGITAFDKPDGQTSGLLAFIRKSDGNRMKEMTSKMSLLFKNAGHDLNLSDTAIIRRVAERHNADESRIILQERHIAQAFQEVLFEKTEPGLRKNVLSGILGIDPERIAIDPVGVQTQIRSSLMKAGRPAFVTEDFLEFGQACELILGLGGIPCYPVLADGSPRVCEFESSMDDFLKQLHLRDIHMAEFIPPRNSPDVLLKYAKALRNAGVAVVAGTEHNTLDLGRIEPLCADGAPPCAELSELFWEGTCVITAHMHLKKNGLAGFVDRSGIPHPDFDSADARIRAFAELGSRIINCLLQ